MSAGRSDPFGGDHGCIHPGCDAFGGFGRKRKGAAGSFGYDWYCGRHRPVADGAPVRQQPLRRTLDRGGQGRML